MLHSRKNRFPRVGGAVALGLAAALTFSACSGGGTDAGDKSSGDQTLTFGLSSDPPQPITGVSQGAAMNALLAMVHRGLMQFNTDGSVGDGLAESVEQPDDTTYVFTLREGLTFNDGSELTADNVKATLDYIRDVEHGTFLAPMLTDVDSVESDGERSVTVKLKTPNTAFLEMLALPYASIVPDASLNPETPNWVGAGPFSMTELEQGIGVTMEKYDGYYSADSVALDSIEVKFYPDGEARTNALLSGDVDLIDYVTWENFDRVADAGFTVDSVDGPFQYVQFNVDGTPFADPKVRQAVAYALNRDNSVLAAFQGNGSPLYGVSVLDSDPAYDKNLGEMWEYNPEKAKQLLAEAGYPDGFDATLLATSQYTFLQDNALSVKEDLAAVGINATLDSPDWAGRIAKGNEGDYDLAVSGDTGILTDPSYLQTWVVDGRSYNVSWGYKNDQIKELIGEGLRATDDADKHAVYQKVRTLWKEDVPFASLNVRAQAYGYNDSVAGFEPLPGTLVFFSGYNFENISMK